MQTPVEIFDEWLSLDPESGPRFHPIPDEIAEPFQEQLRVFAARMVELRKQFKPNHDIEIYTDFIDDGTCNAGAGIYKNMGLIGLNKGAVLLPLEMFYRMFSHPLVLKTFGDSSRERIGPQHREGMPNNYDTLIEIRKKAGRPLLPKPPLCPARKAAAELCADLNWRFIAMHELTHILHGHCEYLQNTQSIPFILEVHRSTGSSPARQSLDRQTIEFWADAKAVEVVMGGFLTKSPSVVENIVLRPQQKLFLWSFSLYTLFRMWGLSIDANKLADSTYPPTALRFEYATIATGRRVAAKVPEIGEDYLKINHAGQMEAENAIKYCGGATLLPDDLADVQDPSVDAHIEILCHHFDNVLCPELKKRSYVELYPV